MTNLEHLDAAQGCLTNDGRHTLAHVVQDAREEIMFLRNGLSHHEIAPRIADLKSCVLALTTERDALKAECERLREQMDQKIQDFLNEKACCNGQECGCMGVTRLQQFVHEEAGSQLAAERAGSARLVEASNALLDIICTWIPAMSGTDRRVKNTVANVRAAIDAAAIKLEKP